MITDYLKYIVDNKYLLFADITKEQKTLIMKSMLRDKIIKYIYFIAEKKPVLALIAKRKFQQMQRFALYVM